MSRLKKMRKILPQKVFIRTHKVIAHFPAPRSFPAARPSCMPPFWGPDSGLQLRESVSVSHHQCPTSCLRTIMKFTAVAGVEEVVLEEVRCWQLLPPHCKDPSWVDMPWLHSTIHSTSTFTVHHIQPVLHLLETRSIITFGFAQLSNCTSLPTTGDLFRAGAPS